MHPRLFGCSSARCRASRAGIEAYIARAFQDAGAQMAITGAEIGPAREDRMRFTCTKIDITNREAVSGSAKATPTLDVLVNCAAITSGGEVMVHEFFERVVSVNLRGTFR